MILSPRIEKLAFQGLCRWVVFNTAYSSTATIPVPDGGFIILRQIIFYPYLSGATLAAQLQGSAHQLSLVEQGSQSELVYQFRDSISQVSNLGVVSNVASGSPTIVETFATFKKNICIDLLNVPDVAGAVYGAATIYQAQAQERPNPLGYNGTALTPNIAISGTENYFPSGEQRPFAGVSFAGAGAGVRDQLRYNYQAGRTIPAPVAADGGRQFQYPLVSFGCWVFNIPISEYLNY